MKFVLTKKDLVWGYFAQIFSAASGVITLPYILKMLSAQEIGMNYLMLTVGALVGLIDFGFAPQFGRNITYIFSGVQRLKKEGLDITYKNEQINFRLLATMIYTARFIYCRMAALVLIVMLTFGSLYIYKVTEGFSNVKYSFLIWVVYSISVFFNIYYSYYSSLLTGKGLIMEAKKSMVYSKAIYILLVFIFLYFGLGLLGVVLANLISPFVNRCISYYYFFTDEMKFKIRGYAITVEEKKETLQTVWHNSRKMGLVLIGAYSVSRISMFLAGLFFTLSEVASYGLMLQLVGLIMTFSSTFFCLSEPRFAALRITRDNQILLKEFAFSINIYMLLYLFGIVFLSLFGQNLLLLIGSNALLPTTSILLIYSLVMFLEGHLSCFSTFIVTKNDIPFVESSLISGICIAIGSYLSLRYTAMGMLGLVLVQGLCQLAYPYWKWPYYVCKDFEVSYSFFLKIGIDEFLYKIKKILSCKIIKTV